MGTRQSQANRPLGQRGATLGAQLGRQDADTHSLGLHPGLLHPKGHLRVLVAQQDVRNTRGWVAGVEMLAAVAQVLLTFQTLPALCKSENSIRLCTGRTWEPQLLRRASRPTLLREAQTPGAPCRVSQALTLAVPVAQLLAGHERRLAEDGVGHPSRAQRFSCH